MNSEDWLNGVALGSPCVDGIVVSGDLRGDVDNIES